ncbi:hypothetical protein BCR34DRAFT_4981 [Clohesyomyces aquaticus]|uniref:Uncharacterized protein n=1 Tax=Clohesyomyces aquaticus TaxID=1231657 RepID=A0A1Y2ABH1_9PLEO|nr:hypothetical protein BCR34DRAFT_4981 [Clohesyomyces aquaticus]
MKFFIFSLRNLVSWSLITAVLATVANVSESTSITQTIAPSTTSPFLPTYSTLSTSTSPSTERTSTNSYSPTDTVTTLMPGPLIVGPWSPISSALVFAAQPATKDIFSKEVYPTYDVLNPGFQTVAGPAGNPSLSTEKTRGAGGGQTSSPASSSSPSTEKTFTSSNSLTGTVTVTTPVSLYKPGWIPPSGLPHPVAVEPLTKNILVSPTNDAQPPSFQTVVGPDDISSPYVEKTKDVGAKNTQNSGGIRIPSPATYGMHGQVTESAAGHSFLASTTGIAAFATQVPGSRSEIPARGVSSISSPPDHLGSASGIKPTVSNTRTSTQSTTGAQSSQFAGTAGSRFSNMWDWNWGWGFVVLLQAMLLDI